MTQHTLISGIMKKLNNSGWEIKLSDDNCGLIYSLYLGIFESSAGNISEMTEKIFFQLTEKTKNFSLNKQKNIDELIFYISINNGTEFDNFNYNGKLNTAVVKNLKILILVILIFPKKL